MAAAKTSRKTKTKEKNRATGFDPKQVKRIGILTGGGDCPGLNSVIRGVVRSATLKHNWEVWGIRDGFDGLLAGAAGKLTMKDVRGLQIRGGTILGTSNRGNPLDYPVKKDGIIVYEDVTGEIVQNAKKMKLDCLIAVGGDGTMKIAQAIHEQGVPVVGVPKTIDNDLEVTDVTFGYNSAVDCATDAIDKLHTTAESHHRVLVLEVMGRDCGWIALEAGIAGGADAILIPEIPFDLDFVCEHIHARKKKGSRFSIVVVAEGAYPEGGRKMYEKEPGPDGTPGRLGGIARWVAERISHSTSLESRVAVLGHLQRGGKPTTYDRVLATRFGVGVVDLIAAGHAGHMVCLKGRDIEHAPIERAVRRLKRVDPDGQVVLAAEALGISLGRKIEY
ncbi:MAG: ATP-dependent 6-phosphofructokinase [Candidatus Krumholzibacteriota bacterium]|nr:ATP-dependent 6-phosphofructokinase [Candidatus Krumholzibacteriota bacterium]